MVFIRFVLTLAATTLLASVSPVSAQAYVAYYPAPVVAAPPVFLSPPPVPTVVYRPVTPVVAATPVLPAPVLVASPVVPAPVAVAPVAPAPVALVTPVPTLRPVVRTRYRPILGGTVSRVRYRYAPGVVVTPLY